MIKKLNSHLYFNIETREGIYHLHFQNNGDKWWDLLNMKKYYLILSSSIIVQNLL